MRLAGFNIFQQFLQAKKVGFLDFNVIKLLKVRLLLEIRVFLVGESYQNQLINFKYTKISQSNNKF